jgi:hypothetical protein
MTRQETFNTLLKALPTGMPILDKVISRVQELEQQLAAKDALLRQASGAFHSISLCEFNSMSSRQEMGRLARDAVAAIDKELK